MFATSDDSQVRLQKYGYFTHPGKQMKGAFVGLSESAASGEKDCALKCNHFPGCQGIAFSSSPSSCLLLSGEDMRFLETPETDDVFASSKPSDTAMKITTATNKIWVVPEVTLGAGLSNLKYGDIFWFDKDFIYCYNNSNECAGAREYFECLQVESCTTQKDFEAHRNLCHTMSCSPAQCGFNEAACDSMVMTCANNFIACIGVGTVGPDKASSQACACTKAYMGCLERAECLDDPLGKHLSASMDDLAWADGCTSEDLGQALCS